MSVFKVLGSIAKTAWKVGGILLPIVRVFRQSSPEVDEFFDKVDDAIDVGGAELDDFFDRNMGTIDDMEGFSREAATCFTDLEGLCQRIRVAAADDAVTPVEAQALGEYLASVKTNFDALFTRAEEVEASVALLQP